MMMMMIMIMMMAIWYQLIKTSNKVLYFISVLYTLSLLLNLTISFVMS